MLLLCSWVYQAEDVVEDEIAAGSIWEQLESLGVAHRSLLSLDQQSATNDDQDATRLVARLCVKGRDLVLNLLEWQVLFYASACALLRSFLAYPDLRRASG